MFFKWGCVTFLEVVHRVVKNEITTQIPIAVFATSADRQLLDTAPPLTNSWTKTHSTENKTNLTCFNCFLGCYTQNFLTILRNSPTIVHSGTISPFVFVYFDRLYTCYETPEESPDACSCVLWERNRRVNIRGELLRSQIKLRRSSSTCACRVSFPHSITRWWCLYKNPLCLMPTQQRYFNLLLKCEINWNLNEKILYLCYTEMILLQYFFKAIITSFHYRQLSLLAGRACCILLFLP